MPITNIGSGIEMKIARYQVMAIIFYPLALRFCNTILALWDKIFNFFPIMKKLL